MRTVLSCDARELWLSTFVCFLRKRRSGATWTVTLPVFGARVQSTIEFDVASEDDTPYWNFAADAVAGSAPSATANAAAIPNCRFTLTPPLTGRRRRWFSCIPASGAPSARTRCTQAAAPVG